MKKIPEQVLAFIGGPETGKSRTAIRITRGSTPLNREEIPKDVDPASDSQLVDCYNVSERSEYFAVNSDEKCVELVVAPGHRKYWKWQDYVLSDADSAIIFVPDVIPILISSLIEPLVHLIAFGVNLAGIVVTNASAAVSEAIRVDLNRVFPSSIANGVPIFHLSCESDYSDLRSFILNDLPAPPRSASDPFSLCITRIHGTELSSSVEGKILSGQISVGETVRLMPADISLQVESICTNDMETPESASEGQLVGLRLRDINPAFLSKGMVLVKGPHQGRSSRNIVLKVNVFNSPFPIRVGFSPMISILGCHVHGRVIHIDQELNLGDSGVVHVSLNKAVWITLDEPKRLTRATIRQENIIVAVGRIIGFLD